MEVLQSTFRLLSARALLLVAEGEVEVTDVGVGVATGCNIYLEYDAVTSDEATGRWVGRASGCLDLP